MDFDAVVPLMSVAVTVMVFCPAFRGTLLTTNRLLFSEAGRPLTVTPVSTVAGLPIEPVTVTLLLLIVAPLTGEFMVI